MTQRASPLAVAMVLGSCLSLQFGAALALQLFPVAGSWGVTTLRLGLAGLLLLIVMRPNVRAYTRASWLSIIVFAATMAGMNGFFYASIERLPLSTAVSIEFLGPLILAAVLARRPRDIVWVVLAFLGMAILGVAAVWGSTDVDPLGALFALIAGGFWAGYILASRRVGQMVPGRGALSIAILIAALMILPFGAGSIAPIVLNPLLLLIALGTAVLASVIPYSLEFEALKRLPGHVFGVLLSLEPVAAAFAGFVMAGQTVAPLQWLSIALVVAASVGITLSHREPDPSILSEPDGGFGHTGPIQIVRDEPDPSSST